MDLQRLINDAPRFHVDARGEDVLWGAGEDLLRFLDRHVAAGARTLETGAGLSTVMFAAGRAHHTCVTPGEHEIARISSYCRSRGISIDTVDFRVGPSEEVLPRLPREPLDVVLIDGSHAFPTPFIDWFYAGRRLRAGGYLIIDDTQLWTGYVLERFLCSEPGWALVERHRLRSAVFVKRSGDETLSDWMDQPFVVRRSRPLQAGYRAAAMLRLLRPDELPSLPRKVRRRLRRIT